MTRARRVAKNLPTTCQLLPKTADDNNGGSQKRNSASDRHLLQHFHPDLAGGDLAQRDDGRLVAALDLRRMTLSKLTCAIGRRERQLETVRDLFKTVFYGDAGHVCFLLDMFFILPYVTRMP
jgi:hypothetical protein